MKRRYGLLIILLAALPVCLFAEDASDQLNLRVGLAELQLQGAATTASLQLLTDSKVSDETTKALAEATGKVADLYRDATTDGPLTREMVRHALREWSVGRASARTAPQISQIHDEVSIRLEILQVAQNQRIIALLEQLPKKEASGAPPAIKK